MTIRTNDLVGQLISDHLHVNPRTRDLYRANAELHASVEMARKLLCVLADEMDSAGLQEPQVQAIVGATLRRLVSDRLLDEQEALLRLLSWPPR